MFSGTRGIVRKTASRNMSMKNPHAIVAWPEGKPQDVLHDLSGLGSIANFLNANSFKPTMTNTNERKDNSLVPMPRRVIERKMASTTPKPTTAKGIRPQKTQIPFTEKTVVPCGTVTSNFGIWRPYGHTAVLLIPPGNEGSEFQDNGHMLAIPSAHGRLPRTKEVPVHQNRKIAGRRGSITAEAPAFRATAIALGRNWHPRGRECAPKASSATSERGRWLGRAED
mmetsp:Transcript_115442/g.226385  ORF Transcript_115442/g.226385 Transcript_115442/m.226385 type:complete len:225 (-) Transcript_115442:6-680(-)